METEERLDELEKMGRDALLKDMATDIVISALIATHPNPEYFRVVFVSLIERQVALLAEHGFETGRHSRIPKGLADEIRKHAQSWLKALPPKPPADESEPPAS